MMMMMMIEDYVDIARCRDSEKTWEGEGGGGGGVECITSRPAMNCYLINHGLLIE